MKDFEYAAPQDEAELLELLSPQRGHTEILAGGTDLVGLMKQMIVTPSRVVNIKEISSWQGVHETEDGVALGAATSLAEIVRLDLLDDYPALKQAIQGISSLQIQSQGTLGGELCQRPQCWYFRSGHGLLADEGRRVVEGDNRYHAILGASGPAKFVSASRLAPALISLGGTARIIGPGVDDETFVPLEAFFQTPRSEDQRETVLAPNQALTHVHLPRTSAGASATYEVRHGEGPDYPLAAAAAWLSLDGRRVRDARLTLGHVAPVPWVVAAASDILVGRPISRALAAEAAAAAVAGATPLSENRYKVQLARVAAERAILLAAGLDLAGRSDHAV